ncbi:hypothetical protein BUALT_Bualt09G0072100 [Buddleja alternifolia]|uniref:Glycosyltransferases n=1 Tax=Buddleja alternifolia TaxID=168488 RepID=A0AAV6X7W7_9LAMI|nr:hypothetical protein BUALT_Bualt09G0072100 [Buddleja alternifolia]
MMGSSERSKKKIHLWKKAIVHFSLCFVTGFFTGFFPTNKPSTISSHVPLSFSSSYSPQPIEVFHRAKTQTLNRSLLDETEPTPPKKMKIPEKKKKKMNTEEINPRRLVIVITPTNKRNKVRGALLRRLANTLKLVAQPLLWIVVEQQQKSDDSSEVSEILRKTGIMYRHVVFKDNFTDVDSEMDHQRNIALNHIEQHRLSGIVHFAGLENVYDLSFFEEIRAIEAFGTWPVAKLSPNKNRVILEGPVCNSSEITRWHLKKMNNLAISTFAFNSSILWDPERWGRTSSVQDTSQNSLKFVRKEALEEETKLKGICSKVLLWDLQLF